MRRLLVLVLLAPVCALGATGPAPAAAPASRRVSVIVLRGMTLADLMEMPNIAAVFRSGASALVSTRTAEKSPSARGAYATLGAGRLARPNDDATALAKRAASEGVGFFVDGAPEVRAELGVRDPGPAPARQSVTIFSEPGDADALAGRIHAGSTGDDALIVLVLEPPQTRLDHRVFLGAVAIQGFGYTRGLLTSATTHRHGVVSLADIAPTILGSAGVPAPAAMRGHVVDEIAAKHPDATLRALERDLVHVAAVRSRLVRGYLWLSMLVLAILAVSLATRRTQHLASPQMVALGIVAAGPLALFVEPLARQRTFAGSAITVAGVACALGVAAVLTLGGSRAIASICTGTAIVVLGDLVLGARIAERSPISYLIAEGSRFYGIGNELMGVVVGCTLVAVAFAYDRRVSARAPGALLMTLAVAAMALPGAKLGSVMVSVPAFGLLAAHAGGRRLGVRLGIVLEAIAAGTTGVLLLADRARPEAQRSHIGAVGSAGTGATLSRKIGAALRLLAFSIWMVTLLVAAACVALVVRRRAEDARAMFRFRPHLRAASLGATLATAGALAFNDAGTEAAALISIIVASAIFGALATYDSLRAEMSEAA